MTYLKTERLPGEPIIVSTYADHITVQDIQYAGNDIETFIRTIRRQSIYMIIDVRQGNGTFKDMLDILRMPQDDGHQEMQSAGIQIHVMMVGTDAMAKFYVQAAQQRQYGHQQIPLFVRVEDAIAAAQIALANEVKQADRVQPAL